MQQRQSETYSMSFDNVVNSGSANTGSASDETDLKKNLYMSMKNSGVLNSLKSQLRSKLYDQLRLKNEKADVHMRET